MIDPLLALTVAAVADEGTLDAAARRLHVTPSAVSQRIKLLEQQIGQRLLVRSKPARATPAGDIVIRFARQVALIDQETSAALGASGNPDRVSLPIGINSDSLAAWILPPLAAFAGRHEVELDLRREDQDRTASLLENGDVVAAVTAQEAAVAGCRSTPLGRMTFEAMASPGWVERWLPDGPTAKAFSRAPRIDYDRGDQLQIEWLRHLGVDGHAAPRHLVPSTHDIVQAIEIGLGWGAVPAVQAEDLVAAGRLVRLGGPPVSTPLFWQCWNDGSALLTALTDEIVAAARQLLPSG